MRIVVLGGAGEVGAPLTRDLASYGHADELLVADVDGAKAHALAEELGGGVRAIALDIRDRAAGIEALAGADVLMNCTSFTLFDAVIDVAAAAGVQYADLLSVPTEAQRRRVREAGITAISGLGATPGLSNVLVRDAAGELDELKEAHLSWVSFRTIAPAPGLLDTILWELAENCPTRLYYQNGRHLRAGFMEGSKVVEFASPIGAQRVYYVPHTEVTSLPQHFPTLEFCAVRGTWRPELMEDVRVLNKYGLLDEDELEHTKARIWERFGGQRDAAPWTLFVNVEVVGTRAGEVVSRVYDVSHPLDWGQDGTGRMTGVCAAVGAQLLGRHGRAEPGFVDPEAYYDPKEYLAELARRRSVDVAVSERPLPMIDRGG